LLYSSYLSIMGLFIITCTLVIMLAILATYKEWNVKCYNRDLYKSYTYANLSFFGSQKSNFTSRKKIE
jgi:hypothetical protein